MTPETTTASARETELVDAVAQGAAEKASTAQDFQREYEQRVRDIMGSDRAQTLSPELMRQLEDRKVLFRRALKDAGHARLENHAPNVGGTNTLSGGTDNMTLNRNMVAAVRDEKSAEEMGIVVAHENGHGEARELRGTLVLPQLREKVHGDIQELMQEGWAEAYANRKMGKSLDFHRTGQPDKVYRQGHDLMLDLMRKTSWQDVEELMTSGNLHAFQKKMLTKNPDALALAA